MPEKDLSIAEEEALVDMAAVEQAQPANVLADVQKNLLRQATAASEIASLRLSQRRQPQQRALPFGVPQRRS